MSNPRTTAVVLFLLLGACSTAEVPPPTVTTSSSAAPTPAAPADYQASLAAFDNAVRPALDAVHATGSIPDMDAARIALAKVIWAEAKKLESVTPPAAAAQAHRQLAAALDSSWDSMQKVDLATPPKPDTCGNATPPIPAAKQSIDAVLGEMQKEVKALADVGFQVGTFMTPAPAPPPPTADRRAANGKIIQRSGPRGRGRLKINNGGGDVAISIVTGDPSKPQVMMYVRSEEKATVTGISGTYQVFFKSGTDWDEGRRGFTRNCAFEKFDKTFDQTSDWEITLTQSAGGNASTSKVAGY